MTRRRPKSLRLVWVEAFIAVAETGSQLDAAKRLKLNQATVSRHIWDLEIWLRRMLFESKFPVVLNEDGLAFLPTARQVMKLLQESRAIITPIRHVSGKDIDMSWWKPEG